MGYSTHLLAGERVTNLPKPPDKRINPLPRAQIRTLLDAMPPYWRPVVMVMVTCGMRRSEASGLTRDNMDLDSGVIRVEQQLVVGQLVAPRTKKARRTIPLAPSTVQVLRTHLEDLPPNDLDLVFPTTQTGGNECGCQQ